MRKDEWPFDDWMRLAVTRFGIAPSEFWRMSLRDWLTLSRPRFQGGLSAENLAELMRCYPDKEKENG